MIREVDGSLVANSSPPLNRFIVEDCSDDEELEEEYSSIDDSIIDAPLANAPPVEVSLVDASIVLIKPCVA
ncbi:hypothetical protein POTOM_059765 [Populus tomentosa]|uniref:Uncharacterized protein n=1 Tax=Populus tomentosa TaxID=118781 RepID=A0A8X7XSR1_POPTO|nr:hypothetical protein POTOM_059765 [Populus tomentosa]